MADKSDEAAGAQSEETLVCIQKSADVAFPLSLLILVSLDLKLQAWNFLFLPCLLVYAGLGVGFLPEIHPWRRHDLQLQRRVNASAVLGQEQE